MIIRKLLETLGWSISEHDDGVMVAKHEETVITANSWGELAFLVKAYHEGNNEEASDFQEPSTNDELLSGHSSLSARRGRRAKRHRSLVRCPYPERRDTGFGIRCNSLLWDDPSTLRLHLKDGHGIETATNVPVASLKAIFKKVP